jgi:aminopeptidase 2
MILRLKEEAFVGSKPRLKQTFKGSMLHHSLGFFRAPYTRSDGTQKWMVATHVEPTGARKVFTCLDEPALKATFSVTLVVDKHLTALGNMDVASDGDLLQ